MQKTVLFLALTLGALWLLSATPALAECPRKQKEQITWGCGVKEFDDKLTCRKECPLGCKMFKRCVPDDKDKKK